MNETIIEKNGLSAFSALHPAAQLVYFCTVIGVSMLCVHPVIQLAGLAGAACFYLKAGGTRGILKLALPFAVFTAAVNALFNHRGATVLFLLPTKNAFTLESLLYGLSAAVMMITVLMWFGGCSKILASDKITYLFGKTLPSLSLVLSMTLRFVPRFTERFEEIKEARQCLGFSGNSKKQRLKNAFCIFSVMTAWALEGSIETADSMKARGYGLRGRTFYSLYAFTERDLCALLLLFFADVFLISGAVSGGLKWRYFPSAGGAISGGLSVSLWAVYLALCAAPVLLELWEDGKWNRSR